MKALTRTRDLVLCSLVVCILILAGCQSEEPQTSQDTPASTPASTPLPTDLMTAEITEINTTTEFPTIHSGPFRMVAPLDEIIAGSVKTLFSTADGSLWLVTNQQVARIVDESVVLYLNEIQGSFAGVDGTGRVWVVSEDGSKVSAWNGMSWAAYGEAEGWTALSPGYKFTDRIQSTRDGNYWIATSGEVRHL